MDGPNLEAVVRRPPAGGRVGAQPPLAAALGAETPATGTKNRQAPSGACRFSLFTFHASLFTKSEGSIFGREEVIGDADLFGVDGPNLEAVVRRPPAGGRVGAQPPLAAALGAETPATGTKNRQAPSGACRFSLFTFHASLFTKSEGSIFGREEVIGDADLFGVDGPNLEAAVRRPPAGGRVGAQPPLAAALGAETPATGTTSEQSPLCSDVFLCPWQKRRHPPAPLLLLSKSQPLRWVVIWFWVRTWKLLHL